MKEGVPVVPASSGTEGSTPLRNWSSPPHAEWRFPPLSTSAPSRMHVTSVAKDCPHRFAENHPSPSKGKGPESSSGDSSKKTSSLGPKGSNSPKDFPSEKSIDPAEPSRKRNRSPARPPQREQPHEGKPLPVRPALIPTGENGEASLPQSCLLAGQTVLRR